LGFGVHNAACECEQVFWILSLELKDCSLPQNLQFSSEPQWYAAVVNHGLLCAHSPASLRFQFTSTGNTWGVA